MILNKENKKDLKDLISYAFEQNKVKKINVDKDNKVHVLFDNDNLVNISEKSINEIYDELHSSCNKFSKNNKSKEVNIYIKNGETLMKYLNTYLISINEFNIFGFKVNIIISYDSLIYIRKFEKRTKMNLSEFDFSFNLVLFDKNIDKLLIDKKIIILDADSMSSYLQITSKYKNACDDVYVFCNYAETLKIVYDNIIPKGISNDNISDINYIFKNKYLYDIIKNKIPKIKKSYLTYSFNIEDNIRMLLTDKDISIKSDILLICDYNKDYQKLNDILRVLGPIGMKIYFFVINGETAKQIQLKTNPKDDFISELTFNELLEKRKIHKYEKLDENILYDMYDQFSNITKLFKIVYDLSFDINKPLYDIDTISEYTPIMLTSNDVETIPNKIDKVDFENFNIINEMNKFVLLYKNFKPVDGINITEEENSLDNCISSYDKIFL